MPTLKTIAIRRFKATEIDHDHGHEGCLEAKSQPHHSDVQRNSAQVHRLPKVSPEYDMKCEVHDVHLLTCRAWCQGLRPVSDGTRE
jgi:hypothetical protein